MRLLLVRRTLMALTASFVVIAISTPLTSASASASAAAVAPHAGALAFIGGSSANFTEGLMGRFSCGVKVGPVAFSWTGKLPTGLAMVPSGDGATAELEGVPAVGTAGAYVIHLTAKGASSSATEKLTIQVAKISATNPVVTDVIGSGAPKTIAKVEGKNLGGAAVVQFGATSAHIELDESNVIEVLVPNVPNGVVAVRVKTKGGTSPLAFGDLFDVQAVPAAPTLTSVAPVGLGVDVAWARPAATDQVTGYQLSAVVDPGYGGSVPSGCGSPAEVNLGSSALSGEITGCQGIPYDVSVVAENANGASDPATSAASTPLAAQDPGAPVLLGVNGVSGGLDVNWAAPDQDGGSGLTSFMVAAVVGTTPVVELTTTSTATSAELTGLTNFTTYSVEVVAVNAIGDSPAATGTGTPSPWNTPSAPSGLEVLPQSNGTSIKVSWSPPDTVGSDALSGYVLQYAAAASSSQSCTATATAALAKGWKSGATLHVKLPSCAVGVTSATIGGVVYPALELTSTTLQLTPSAPRALKGATLTRGYHLVSSGGKAFFTQNDVGHPIEGAGLPSGTVITAISSPTAAFVSNAPTTTTTSAVLTVGSGANPAITKGATMLLAIADVSPATMKTLDLPASTTSYTISGLSGADFYDVSVQAESGVGGGTVLSSLEPVSPSVKLAKGAVSLSLATADALTADYPDLSGGGNFLVWPSTAPAQVLKLVPGDVVILGGEPSGVASAGMIATVQSLSRGPDGQYVLDTVPAELTQAFISFSFSYYGVPVGAGSLSSSTTRAHGASANRGVIDPSFTWSGPNNSSVTGQISLTPNVSARASVGFFSGASMTVSASLTASESLSGYLDGSTSIDLGDIPIFDTVFFVGPVPVEVSCDIEPEIDLSGNVTFSEAASATLGGSLTFAVPGGISTQNNSGASVQGTPTISGSGSAELKVPVDLCAYVDVLCGDVAGTATLNVSAYSSGNPYYLKICPSIGLEVGYSVNILWWHPSGSRTLASLNLPCWQNPAAGTRYEVGYESGTSPYEQALVVGGFGNSTAATNLDPGTHPSITSLATGGYEVAYQNTSHNLVSVGADGTENWNLGMLPGTSPSISGLSGGGYVIAMQANTGALWIATVNSSGQTSTLNTGLGMMGGTNPAIAGTTNGGYAVAFQVNTSLLYLASYNGTLSVSSTGDGMDTASSPSIVALPQGGYEAAMAANTDILLTRGYGPGSSWVSWGDGVSAGTTPSIIVQGSSPAVIFQANGSHDLYDAWVGPISTPYPMVPNTSPAAVGLPSGGYEVAYIEADSGNVIQTLGNLGSTTWLGAAYGSAKAAPSIMNQ